MDYISGDFPEMTTTLSTKGQVVIPRKLREACGLEPGAKLRVKPLKGGGMTLRPEGAKPRPSDALLGLLPRKKRKSLSARDMDRAIMKAVRESDARTKSPVKQ